MENGLLTTTCLIKSETKISIAKDLTHNAKNLYNKTLYLIRQHYFDTKEYINYYGTYPIIKDSSNEDGVVEYYELPTNSSQQVLRLVDKNFKSFFKAIKSSKMKGKKINIPGYLDKDGYIKVTFTKIHMSFDKKYVNLTLPKSLKMKYNLKFLQFRIPRNIKNYDDIQEISIIPLKNGKIFNISFVCKSYKLADPLPSSNGTMAIDLGINNIASIVSDRFNATLVSGKSLKSLNQYFNKKYSNIQSDLMINHKKYNSKRLDNLWRDHNNRIKDYIHKLSKYIVELAVTNGVSTIVIGKNDFWKQNVNIGKVNNQNFVNIPHSKLVEYIEYRSKLYGINVVTIDESYTSKCDALALEDVKKQQIYLGKRVHRGLFSSSTGKYINADVNGAINICRKYLSKDKSVETSFVQSIVSSGFVNNPRVVKISAES
jgi:putative transposase